MRKDIRYDEMFGCVEKVNSDLVTKPEQVVPALERSFSYRRGLNIAEGASPDILALLL